MNKVKCEFVHGKRGKWELKNKLDYTTEELEIIVKAATAAIESNKRYYEREVAEEKAKAEKRKNKVGIKEKIFNNLFCCEEE